MGIGPLGQAINVKIVLFMTMKLISDTQNYFENQNFVKFVTLFYNIGRRHVKKVNLHI